MFIKGWTITPAERFQQATRTTNINNLYVYGVDVDKHVDLRSIEQTEEYYKAKYCSKQKIGLMFSSLGFNDNPIHVFGSCLHLYAYNKFVLNVYKSNKVKHVMNL